MSTTPSAYVKAPRVGGACRTYSTVSSVSDYSGLFRVYSV
nr:MAG TPA: hypothetical protein [Caudoviricetes sp.]